MSNRVIRVLFVCMGNICRSPTAEGVFRHYVDAQGVGARFEIDSAGTIAYHVGETADERMRKAALARGYQLDSIARAVTQGDIIEFDLVVAMDADNLADLQRLHDGATSHVVMLGQFLPDYEEHDVTKNVPDPYYGGADGFEEVLDMIESACPGLLAHCIASE